MFLRTMTACTLAACLAVTARPHAADAPYQKVKEIQIGGDGGWDYLHVDSTARRLYVSHATKVIVVDLVKDEVVGEIADTPGVHGVVAGANGRIYTSNGREARVSVVDARTLKTIQKVETAPNPDFIMYEPSRQEVYAFNASGSATVIDTAGVVTATIPLGGKPEAAVVDATEGLAYVNIEDKNEIAVVDIARHEVTARWSIAPGQAAAGLALDAHTHRLFIGAHNKLMLMMDSHTGQILSQVTIGTGVDSTWFDPGTGYAFSSCGDGTTTLAHEDSPTSLRLAQTLQTAVGARTMALDPLTHRIYLSAAKFETLPADAPANARPKPVPGSMHVLVFGLNGK